MNKVFKFYSKDCHYAIAAKTQEEAQEYLFETVGEMEIVKVEEIPESEWDKKDITIYEDNDRSSTGKMWYVSIRQEIIGEEPQMIFTNDQSLCE